MRPIVALLALGLALRLTAGCAAPAPRPIDPRETEARFRARSLDDPGLLDYLERSLAARLPPVPPASWDLGLLTLVSFYYHPDLDLARARLDEAGAAMMTARAWPNPRVGGVLGRAFGDRLLQSPWIFGFDLDYPVETGGKRGHRQARARSLGEAARCELAEAGWKVYSRLRAALVERLLALEEVRFRREEESARAEWVRLLEERLAAGEVSLPEVAAARLEAARSRLGLLASEGRAGLALGGLAAALGVPAAALEGAAISFDGIERLPPEADLSPGAVQAAGMVNRLDLRRRLAEYQASEADLRLEVARRWPDLNLNPGWVSEEGEKKLSVGLAISIPLFDWNQGPIAEAEARRREAAARFEKLQGEVIQGIEAALLGYASARAELAEAERLLALAGEALEAARRAVEVGQEDPLSLAGRRIETALAARARIEVLRRTQDALGSVEDQVQSPLGTEIALPEAAASGPREGLPGGGGGW